MRLFLNAVIAIACLFFVGTFIARSDEAEHMNQPYTGSKEFERMKTLVGTWEGTSSMGKGNEKVTVKYEITSAGSAIIETLSPGTPHEMVSVYYDNGKKLGMTHYCALGNQPQMELKSANGNKIDLVFTGGTNVDPQKAPHMHELSILFIDKDNIVEEWTFYENGQKKDVTILKLSRVS
jgi:hypothetical protein